jgi:manganese/iron transport system ATP-binding protein
MSVALDIEHLTVRYNSSPVLEDVSFAVSTGERVAIVGPNGAGKSTLFRAITHLVPIEEGYIRVGTSGGRPVEIAYLTQRSAIDWRFPVTVFDMVMMGRVGRIGWLRWYTSKDRQITNQSLEQVGMLQLANRQIGELSGGQQQRVFIARALAQEANILLLDEPFTGLDLPSQESILSLLERLREQHITILLSTHDLTLAVEHFDRLALLNRRLVSYGPPREAIHPDTLRQAYGGKAVWQGEDYVMVLGDITCCGESEGHQHD